MNKNTKLALIIGGTVLAILVILPTVLGAIFGWSGTGWGWGMMGPWMMGFGWGWFMPILMVLFWGLVVWGIMALVRGVSADNVGSSMQADSSLEILKRRYARGEITKEEYKEKKKDLI
jgi:putative membrane protein